MEQNATGIEISLQDLFSIFIKRIWWIITCMVLFAAVAYVYSRYYVVPLYRSDVLFLIEPVNISSLENNYSEQAKLQMEYQGLAYAKQLTNTYLQILQTNNFRNKLAIEYTEKYDKSINGSISIMEVPDTELFRIRVVSNSRNDAFALAQLIETIAPQTIMDIMGTDKIRVVDNATQAIGPINNNTNRNTLLGAFVGAVLSYGIGFLIFILDTRVKDEEDLKKRYDVPMLGGIISFNTSYKINKK